jgi:hypothetical protein
MYSIPSTPIAGPHEFDRVFAEALAPYAPAADARGRGVPRTVSFRALGSWLEGIVRPVGVSLPVYGDVPVYIKGLRCSSACDGIGGSTNSDTLCVEFVVHRYVDWYGVHYTATVSPTRPHRLFAFESVGLVASDQLWSIEQERAYGSDARPGC